LFNQWLHTGTLPKVFAAERTIPVAKHAKPGVNVNLADPDDYRPISVPNVLPKLFGLIFASRLMHWAMRSNVISPEQVGYVPHHGAEWHEFTITETIRARRRAGMATYVLFLDLRKAFDSLHMDAMWLLLARMGVPASLVDVLRTWADMRETELHVNGSKAGSYRQSKGVPQGGVLSPIFFILFIETLVRLLRRMLTGVEINGVTIQSLFFADDVAVVASTADELQQALYLIWQWCASWGMEVGLGHGKTEAMAFPVDADAPAVVLPTLYLAERVVSWVDSYRYLGMIMTPLLDSNAAVGRLKSKLYYNYNRYFVCNPGLRRAPPALQLQVLGSVVNGSINYCLALYRLTEQQCEVLQTVVRRAVRQCFGLPRSAPNCLVESLAPGLTFHGTVARETRRLQLQLQSTPFGDAIAPRLFRALAAEQAAGPTSWQWDSWPRYVARRQAREVALIMGNYTLAHPMFQADAYYDIPRAAAVYARAVSHGRWQKQSELGVAALHQYSDVLYPLDRQTPTQHCAGLMLGYHVVAQRLGDAHRAVPLSIRGPSCQGSILTLTTMRAVTGPVRAVARAQLGWISLHMAPFSVARRNPQGNADTDSDADNASDDDIATGERAQPQSWQELHQNPPVCQACGQRQLTWRHLALRCQHPAMTAARQQLQKSVDECVHQLTKHCQRAKGEALAAEAANAHLELTSIERDALTYRLLMVSPWSQYAADPAEAPALRRLGTLFDLVVVPNAKLRNLANFWVHWAGKNLLWLNDVYKAVSAVNDAADD
jgi:hypothetical protein